MISFLKRIPSLPAFCLTKDVRYLDLMAWIESDQALKRQTEEALDIGRSKRMEKNRADWRRFRALGLLRKPPGAPPGLECRARTVGAQDTDRPPPPHFKK